MNKNQRQFKAKLISIVIARAFAPRTNNKDSIDLTKLQNSAMGKTGFGVTPPQVSSIPPTPQL